MALNFIPTLNKYTALSTDVLTNIDFDHGAKILFLDTGMNMIYDSISDSLVVDRSIHVSSVVQSNGSYLNVGDTLSQIKTDTTAINTTTDNTYDIINSTYNIDRIITANVIDREFRRGNQFGAGYRWSNVADNADVVLHFRTGLYPAYIKYSVNGTALTDYSLNGSPVITTNGTVVDISRRNKMVSFTPTLQVFRDPTYTNIGTARIPRFLGSGTNTASRVGGESSTEQHVLLEPNTDYFVVARNVSGAAQSRIGLYIEWFEVDYYDFG